MSEETEYYQEAAPPNPDLRTLDVLVGEWVVDDPTGADAASGRVRYEWMPGGYFLIQHVELGQDGSAAHGVEYIGHERPFGGPESADIVSRYFGSDGSTLKYCYEVDGDTLTIWAGEKGSPAYFQGTFNADRTVNTGAWVYPGGGGYASRMTRV